MITPPSAVTSERNLRPLEGNTSELHERTLQVVRRKILPDHHRLSPPLSSKICCHHRRWPSATGGGGGGRSWSICTHLSDSLSRVRTPLHTLLRLRGRIPSTPPGGEKTIQRVATQMPCFSVTYATKLNAATLKSAYLTGLSAINQHHFC